MSPQDPALVHILDHGRAARSGSRNEYRLPEPIEPVRVIDARVPEAQIALDAGHQHLASEAPG